MNNVASALNSGQVRVLDVLTSEGADAFKSREMVGATAHHETTFYSRRGEHDDITQAGLTKGLPATQTDASRQLAVSLNRWRASVGQNEPVRFREIQRDVLPDAMDRALGELERISGTRIAVVRNLTPEVDRWNGLTFTRQRRIYLDEHAEAPLVRIENPKRMTLDELMAIDSQDEARALRGRLERDGHDGIHLPEIGQWVDFVWGSTGGETAASGALREGKGIAHLLDARMRRDGLTRMQAERLAQRLVSVIARGSEVRRTEINGNIRAVIADAGDTAVLVKQPGSNSWMLTGWKEKAPGVAGAEYGATGTTLAEPMRSRLGEGAEARDSIAPTDDGGNTPAFSRRAESPSSVAPQDSADLAGTPRSELARMQARAARENAAASRAAVLSSLAAKGYPLGSLAWNQDTGRWEGVKGTLHAARVASASAGGPAPIICKSPGCSSAPALILHVGRCRRPDSGLRRVTA